MKIERLTADAAVRVLPELAALLQDAVNSGASIGFLLPITAKDAANYWLQVVEALRGPNRILLIAKEEGKIVGTVQLDLASSANGSHRAEVAKLMVHTSNSKSILQNRRIA